MSFLDMPPLFFSSFSFLTVSLVGLALPKKAKLGSQRASQTAL